MAYNINWNTYDEIFPERYTSLGYFDSILEKQLKIKIPKIALDIGGGTHGTQVLKQFNIPTDILDPNIVKPSWIRDQVTWDTFNQYDFIVARGSLNYLTLKDLKKIKKLLFNQGVFIANTFINPPSKEWSQRSFKNKNNEEGIEQVRLIDEVLIEHQLLFNNGKKIEHYFNYYSQDFLKNIFIEKTTEYIPYSKNSVLIIYTNTF